MSLPYLLFTDKVSVEDRSPLSLCASPNCRLVFPIFLPKGQQAHISHICERPSSFFPSLAFRALNLHRPSSSNISPFIYFYLAPAESAHGVHMSSRYTKHFPCFWCTTCMGLDFFSLLITPAVGVKTSPGWFFLHDAVFFSAAALESMKAHHCVQKVMVSERFSPAG